MRTLILLIVGGLSLVGGCAGSTEKAEATERNRPEPAPNSPVAYIAGKEVYRDDLWPALAEARGAKVLAEEVLNRLIEVRLAEQGISLNQSDIDTERQIILEVLSPDADQAERVWREIRRDRGLGEHRLSALLRRSAGLRRLIKDQVNVTEEAIRMEYERVYGPRYEARLILVGSAQKAADLLAQLRNGASFMDLAIAHSIDISRAQGGLLPPISPLDVTFPDTIRQAVQQLPPGQVSVPISMENSQWALLKLERKIEGVQPPYDEVKDRLALLLRRNYERVAQETLAREMVAGANVVVFDPTLSRAWQLRKEQMLESK